MLLIAAGVLAGVVLAYLPGMTAPFYFDDWAAIVNNPTVQLTELTWPQLRAAALGVAHDGRWLTGLTFGLNHLVGGLDTTGYHLVNLAVHLVNGLLVFWVVLLLYRTPVLRGQGHDGLWIAALAATLWLLHPVQTQAVTYIWQRSTTLAVLFHLLAFGLYLQARLSEHQRLRPWLYGGVVIAWLLGLLSKEIVAVLPGFLLLAEWYFFQDLRLPRWRRTLPWLLLTVALLAAAAAWYLVLLRGQGPMDIVLRGYGGRDFDVWQRVMTEWRIVVFYLGLFLRPHPSRLSLEHDVVLSQSPLEPLSTLWAGLFILACLVVAMLAARRHRLLSFCILWYFGHLVIESTVIPLELIFEHRLYLPSVGLTLLLAAGADWLRQWRPAAAAPVTLGLIALALLWGSWTQERNRLWADPVTFWEGAVAKAPDSPRARNQLAETRSLAGDTEGAVADYTKVIERSEADPEPTKALTRAGAYAYAQRGRIWLEQGDRVGAAEDLDRSLSLRPDAMTYGYRGRLRLAQQDPQAALQDLTQAVQREPWDYRHLGLRAMAYLGTDEPAKAIADLDMALQLQPELPDLWIARGNACLQARDWAAAERDFGKALALAPDNAIAVESRGDALLGQGQLDAAALAYGRALKLGANPGSIARKLVKLHDHRELSGLKP
jgi:tetratricopeptide (TPR) repeat protein